MKKIIKEFVVCAFLIGSLIFSCKDRYAPAIKDNTSNYLVVEGLINAGTDSTIFNLTRTFKLDGKAVIGAEKAAIVQVEGDNGVIYVLPETARAGVYGRPALGLDATKKYRLRIRTKDNKEYLSDFVECKASPAIDQVRFDLKNDNLNVYANTHDPAGKSRYYLYSATETWEYRVPLTSFFKVENHVILRRDYPDDFLTNCWHSAQAGNIVLGSTANLTQDVLADKRIVSIPPRSEKLLVQYSVLVKQTVLTKEGFEFWESLKKNTEDVGSLFDAQPSQLFGNIRSTTNPADIVIGFVSAGTVSEKRLSIIPADLPAEWTRSPPTDSTCIQSVKTLNIGIPVQTYLTGPNKPLYTPIDEIIVVGIPYPVGYTATDILTCVDCRALGGTNKRPSYWK